MIQHVKLFRPVMGQNLDMIPWATFMLFPRLRQAHSLSPSLEPLLIYLQALSSSAHTPVGYSRVFRAEKGSVSASRYLGSHILTSYSAGNCASLCNAMKGCEGFNIFIERDPSLEPKASKCPNPPSTTNYKCTLWGAPVRKDVNTECGTVPSY
ncbi:hypothetical protein BU16DRAFT_148717 [Lophium mytilinum]|uniref:Apple domain-containing protein n=1 Tax=Lophium mytilinum TaxID=390894 RepID=A0A6A6QFC0_9PEZI|nr:hypothetical protein BU16DRAFT_148717 [Lophium mytilinum]